MAKFCVVKIGNSQYKINEGDEIEVEKIEGERGKSLSFGQVLLFVEDKKMYVGQPLVAKAKVTAKITDQIKGEKIRVATFRAKSRYRRVKGFRPQLTKIKIEKISRG